MRSSSGVRDVKVAALTDSAYYSTLKGLVPRTHSRLWCSLFIVDLTWSLGMDNAVLDVILDLREASWRGVDTRLLVGGSRTNGTIAERSALARDFCVNVGVPCRWLTSRQLRGSHAKVVVADDACIVGSHNWSNGAFHSQTQDSVLVYSAALADRLGRTFERRWEEADR